jgi:hypothetical protein
MLLLMPTAAVVGLLLLLRVLLLLLLLRMLLLSVVRRSSIALGRYSRISRFLHVVSMPFVDDPSIVAVVDAASRINTVMLMLRSRQ